MNEYEAIEILKQIQRSIDENLDRIREKVYEDLYNLKKKFDIEIGRQCDRLDEQVTDMLAEQHKEEQRAKEKYDNK